MGAYDKSSKWLIEHHGDSMLEFPIIQELLAEQVQKDIVRVLRSRFKDVPVTIVERLSTIEDERYLETLVDFAAVCLDLESFRMRLEQARP